MWRVLHTGLSGDEEVIIHRLQLAGPTSRFASLLQYQRLQAVRCVVSGSNHLEHQRANLADKSPLLGSYEQAQRTDDGETMGQCGIACREIVEDDKV